MNIVLFVLSIYKNVFDVKAPEYISFFPRMTYGFNRNAEVLLNISDITTQFVFGLATKKEMKNISSLDSFPQYCDGHEQLSQIQFFINNDTSLNFAIQKKNILTPFFISCDQLYKFEIELEIKNGKYHHDYRYQNAFLFIYITIFTLIGIFILLFLYFIFFRRKDFKYYVTILIFIFLSIIQGIPLCFEFLKNENDEFIMINKRYENTYIIISSIILIYLCIYNIINDSIYYLFHKFHIFWNWFVLIIFNFVLIIIILIINITTLNYSTFFVCSFLYLLFMFNVAMTPSIISLTKIGFMIYICSCFFTFAVRPYIFSFSENICSIGSALIFLVFVNLICTIITIFLLLIDFFILRDYFCNIKRIEQLESDELTLNFSDNGQRYDFLENVQGEINQDNFAD